MKILGTSPSEKLKLVVLFSGGMDSYTLLQYLRHHGHEVVAMSFDYGQRHVKELGLARAVANAHGIEHRVIDVSWLGSLLPGSSLTDSSVAVPHGHYAEESMKQTVVPNRNMILLSIASAFAVAHGFDGVAIGTHSGDHAIYPDCRPDFLELAAAAVQVGNWIDKPFRFHAPFIAMSKGDIARIGAALGLDYSVTWTCYEGGDVPCGKCGSCVEREEALTYAANYRDPDDEEPDTLARPLTEHLS